MRDNTANKYLGDIKCPFFNSITKVSISCEGMDTANRNVMWFASEDEKADFVEKHCNLYPNNCPVAKRIEEKYK